MSKLGRLIRRRRENKRLSAVAMGVYQENGKTAPGARENSKTTEVLQQLLPEIRRDVDQHPRGAVPVQALDQERAAETMIARFIRIPGPIPINEPLPVGTDRDSTDLTEVHDRLRQARLERSYTYASEAARAMGMDLSSYRAHENGSRGLTIKSAMRYAAFFGIDFEWLITGKRETDGKGDRTSLELSLLDEDFELVLRHFWKHLDAEKRRKLIQMAAGLVDCGEGSYDWVEK